MTEMRETVSLLYLPAPQMEEAAAVHHLQEKDHAERRFPTWSHRQKPREGLDG